MMFVALKQDGMAKLNYSRILIIPLTIALLVLLLKDCRKPEPINIQPIEVMSIHEHLKAIDSMNRYVINPLFFKIDSLNEEKAKVIVKTKILYKRIGVDSTLTNEVLYSHTLLDDTSVSYPFNDMVQFRLIQGLEFRGLYNLSKVENNVLKTIIDTKNDIIERDSVFIVELHSQATFLSDSLYKCNIEGANLEIDNRRLKGNNRKLLISTGILATVLIFIGVR